MKVTNKVVEEVVSELAGGDVIPLARLLQDKTNVSEFTLATGLGLEINQTRNMLYRLYEHNLVSFTRKKDKKKGWYIYFWTFNKNRVRDLIKDIRARKVHRMQERLSREKNNQFFICENGCMRLDFEQSHDYKFKCPECGELLNVQDNSKTIKRLEDQLKVLEADLKEAEKIEPIKIVVKKAAKKTTKKAAKKKTAKKKTKKKTVKKKPKKATKKKTKRKTSKKKTKKKAKKAVKKKAKKVKKKTKKTAKRKTSKKKTKKKAKKKTKRKTRKR